MVTNILIVVISGHPEAAQIQKSVRGAAPCFVTPPQGGDTPLTNTPPLCDHALCPQVRRIIPLVFLRFFVILSILAQFHHILTLFAQIMVSKASVTNYGA